MRRAPGNSPRQRRNCRSPDCGKTRALACPLSRAAEAEQRVPVFGFSPAALLLGDAQPAVGPMRDRRTSEAASFCVLGESGMCASSGADDRRQAAAAASRSVNAATIRLSTPRVSFFVEERGLTGEPERTVQPAVLLVGREEPIDVDADIVHDRARMLVVPVPRLLTRSARLAVQREQPAVFKKLVAALRRRRSRRGCRGGWRTPAFRPTSLMKGVRRGKAAQSSADHHETVGLAGVRRSGTDPPAGDRTPGGATPNDPGWLARMF